MATLAIVVGGTLVMPTEAPVEGDRSSQHVQALTLDKRVAAKAPARMDRPAQTSPRRGTVSRALSRNSRRQLQRAAKNRENALEELDEMATRRSEELDAARWVLPAADYRVTARFGQTSYLWSTTHTGVDLAAPTGTPVYAVGGGVVIFAAYDGPYGNKVVVRHEDDTETWYAHLDSIDAAAGQSVAAGDQVGRMGSTGNVTGPHLHLEVRPSGLEPVDPLDAMSDRGVPLE